MNFDWSAVETTQVTDKNKCVVNYEAISRDHVAVNEWMISLHQRLNLKAFGNDTVLSRAIKMKAKFCFGLVWALGLD